MPGIAEQKKYLGNHRGICPWGSRLSPLLVLGEVSELESLPKAKQRAIA